MRILLSCPNDGQTNNYIINALQDLKHDVSFIDHRRFFKEALDGLPHFLKEFNPEVVLVLYLVPGYTYPPDYIRQLKATFPNVKYCSWILDTRITTYPNSLNKVQLLFCDENKDFLNIVKEYDYFFTIVKGQVKGFKDRGVNAHYLPEGYDHYTPRFNFAHQDIDVSFIGQSGGETFPKREKLLKAVFQEFPQGRLYGTIVDDPVFIKVAVGRNTFNDVEHARIVGRTKVNIGHCEWPDLLRSFSARAYRIMGSGGFFMMNSGAHIDDMFEIGKEIITYDSERDCIDKIRYYLDHEDERKQIAANGQQRVLKDYTFLNSMKKMIETIA